MSAIAVPRRAPLPGITYRQLDYWARTGLVEPSIRPAHGSGTQRLYSFRDILVLKIVKRLLDTGVSLQQIRTAVQHLRDHGVGDLAQITLMSDGASVYECTSADEVIDLVQGGQGVFGIAVGRVWREVEGSLAELPSESPDAVPRVRRGPFGSPGRRARRPASDPRDGLTAPAFLVHRSSRLHWALLSTPHGRVPSQPAGGRRRSNPPRNLSGAQDRAGEAPLESLRVVIPQRGGTRARTPTVQAG